MTFIAGQKVLAIVLAGGRGSRLFPLTEKRAKPAVPFLGHYRLIDFSLSNLVNSGVHDVWVIEQYLPHGLNDHLSGGRPWDLDRSRGGLVVLPPFTRADDSGEFAQGNAHALAQHAHLIREFDPDVVLVLSADHIYKLNYTEAIAAHVKQDASVTMVTTRLPDPAQATRFGNLKADSAGKITEFRYKPDEPLGPVVTTEVFVYTTKVLLDTLAELEKQGELGDYGEELLPRLVERGDAYAYPLPGYWMDVGTLDAYWQTQQDFLEKPPFDLADPRWPFITSSLTLPPARIHQGAELNEALVCGGADIGGQVTRSVVAAGAIIERGATVRDSIIQHGVTVMAGATINRAIVDEGAVIEGGATVGGQTARSRLCVVGASAHLMAGTSVGPAQYVAPHTRVKAGEEGRKVKDLEKNDKAGQ